MSEKVWCQTNTSHSLKMSTVHANHNSLYISDVNNCLQTINSYIFIFLVPGPSPRVRWRWKRQCRIPRVLGVVKIVSYVNNCLQTINSYIFIFLVPGPSPRVRWRWKRQCRIPRVLGVVIIVSYVNNIVLCDNNSAAMSNSPSSVNGIVPFT